MGAVLIAAFSTAAATEPPPAPPSSAAFPNAGAVVLAESIRVDIQPEKRFVRHVERRILLRKQERFSLADDHIVYDAKHEKLRSFSARTIRPDGGSVPIPEDLKRDLILVKNDKDEIRQLLYTFPAVEEGAVIEVEYEVESDEWWSPHAWHVQRDIPVVEARFLLRLANSTGSHGRIRMLSRAPQQPWCRSEAPPAEKGFDALETVCRDVPEYRPEPQGPPRADRRLEMLAVFDIELHYMAAESALWRSVQAHWSDRIVKFCEKRRAAASLARELTEGLVSDADRIDRIYSYVTGKLRVRTGDFTDGLSDVAGEAESVDEVLARGGGLPDEMTLLTLVLLQEAGVEAYAVLASDRSDRRFDYDLPDPYQVDHLMIQVNPRGQPAGYLDPSCTYCPPGIPDWRYCGEGPVGVRIRPGHSSPFEVQVGIVPARVNLERRVEKVVLATDGSADIRGTVSWGGQYDVAVRERWADLTPSGRKTDFLDAQTGDVREISTTISDPDAKDRNLSVDFEYERKDAALVAGTDLLIRPNDVFTGVARIPRQERRESAVQWDFARSAFLRSEFVLPPGYRVGELPEKVVLAGPGLHFESAWSHGGGPEVLVWSGRLVVDALQVPTEKYPEALRFAGDLARSLRQGVRATRGREPAGGGGSR